MFLRSPWLVPELLTMFATYADLGLLVSVEGSNCTGVTDPIAGWDDLNDWRRLQSTIGPPPMNWFRLQEVDLVIRPLGVRGACLDAVGLLDEAFVPTEWDEADLSFRIRRAGWKVATHGYERAGAYQHVGSSTLGALSEAYKQRVLGERPPLSRTMDETIRRESGRSRRTWWRRTTAAGWWSTARGATLALATAIGRPGGRG